MYPCLVFKQKYLTYAQACLPQILTDSFSSFRHCQPFNHSCSFPFYVDFTGHHVDFAVFTWLSKAIRIILLHSSSIISIILFLVFSQTSQSCARGSTLGFCEWGMSRCQYSLDLKGGQQASWRARLYLQLTKYFSVSP